MKEIPDTIYKTYLTALLSGDKALCVRIVKELLDKDYHVREIYVSIFQQALYRIGELWEQNKISVATEHIASSITESLMTLVYPKLFSEKHIDRNAVIACVANEYHQIGAKMVADIFELHGWTVISSVLMLPSKI